MRRMKNNVRIEGYVYDHDLEERVTGENSKNPGTEYISGTLSIATDEEMMNIVQVHYTYVTPVTKSGRPNNTYNVLKSIISGRIGSVIGDGEENAGIVRVDSSIGLNEWYNQDGELVSRKRNEGGFIHQMKKNEMASPKAEFDVDMLITGTSIIEGNEDFDIPEKFILKGYIFDFRNSLLPVEFPIYQPYSPAKAPAYFESLDISMKNPVFTRLCGQQISKTVVIKKEEEGAFGEARVTETTSSRRDFVVTWTIPEPYLWDDESTILATEVQKGLTDRELHLAEMKKRYEDYKSSIVAVPSKGEYDF